MLQLHFVLNLYPYWPAFGGLPFIICLQYVDYFTMFKTTCSHRALCTCDNTVSLHTPKLTYFTSQKYYVYQMYFLERFHIFCYGYKLNNINYSYKLKFKKLKSKKKYFMRSSCTSDIYGKYKVFLNSFQQE